MTELAYNPRYAAYARAHDQTPEERLTSDRERWPGGTMVGFILWNRERLQDYGKINPNAFMVSGSRTPALVDHAAYDAWLKEKFP